MNYQLKPDIHACIASDVAIFLDLSEQRYFYLKSGESEKFAELCKLQTGSVIPKHLESWVRTLEERGLIMQADTHIGSHLLPTYEPPRSSLFDEASIDRPLMSVRSLFSLFVAVLQVNTLWRRRNLSAAIVNVRRQAGRNGTITKSQDLCRRQSLRTFQVIIPLLITVDDRCLFRSLLLTKYLSLMSVPAEIVIGVQFDPFAAHCWVQSDGIVLNDHLETVLKFTPIFVA